MSTLREARQSMAMSLKDVAGTVGVEESMISRIETGQQTAAPAVARRLHTLYRGRVDWPEILNLPSEKQALAILNGRKKRGGTRQLRRVGGRV